MQLLGDGGVGEPLRHPLEHLPLPAGQSRQRRGTLLLALAYEHVDDDGVDDGLPAEVSRRALSS